jgi:N-methylhydantoinase B
MPIFVADAVGMAVRDWLEVYGRERLCHGDLLVCNHASVQGQHLNNVVMYTPICAGAKPSVLIEFFAINMHWIDIGGTVPRSTDIFMEGLHFRSIKLIAEGDPIEEVSRIIENNTRFPEALLGDIAAQVALREDTGGAGTFRDGLGFRKIYRIEPYMLQTNSEGKGTRA